ncbi:MAG: hypothetical protein QOC96_2648 [Acidobacteriota bacterium]|nr:hypothetical protein [Acidobacteriota bacterium]
MSRLWWQLPGPQVFISRVVDDLREGQNILLCLPAHLPDGLHSAVRSTLDDEDWHWHTLDIGEAVAERPESLLFARFVPDAGADAIRNAHALAKESSFAGKVIWLDGLDDNSWPAWKEFIVAYGHACQSVPVFERTQFCIPLRGKLALDPPGEDVCLAQHHWRGAVDSLDMFLFTASVFAGREMPALHRRIAVAIAAHLALWDPSISERLAGERLKRILAPVPLLRDVARERDWRVDDAGKWHLGTADMFDGEMRIHSALLALDDSNSEIARRIWSAEVGVLLPFVEERRRELIAQLANALQVPYETRFGEVIEDVRDLEIGHIERQINSLPSVDSNTRSFVRRLREIRNCLSHLEVLPPELLLCDEIKQAML